MVMKMVIDMLLNGCKGIAANGSRFGAVPEIMNETF